MPATSPRPSALHLIATSVSKHPLFVQDETSNTIPLCCSSSSMDKDEQERVAKAPRVHQVGRFWSITPLHEKPLRRLRQIDDWFTDARIAQLVMPLTRQDDRLSLRALDWLVTNFSKKKNIVLTNETLQGPPINIHDAYRSMLAFWRRKNFDPFRRHQRIYFYWQDPAHPEAGPALEETTVGQLNFLHWAEIKGVIRYARQHVDQIETDMATCMSAVKTLKKQDKVLGVKRKRRELSQAPKRSCNIYKVNMEVSFAPEDDQ